MNDTYFSKNGVLLPLSEAKFSLDSLELQYGFGVYESLRTRNGILYFVNEHVDRLLTSARLIGLEHPFAKKEIERYISDLLKKNNAETCNIKMLLIGGKTSEESLLTIFTLAPLFPDRKLYKNGATVETYQYERFLPQVKSLNMLPSYIAYREAKAKGYYDALFIDRGGNIREGTRTNFYVIKGTTIITPPEEIVLSGVVRQTLLAVAPIHGFTIQEKEIPLSSVHNYDGAFLTSTSTKILPIHKIDEVVLPEIPAKLRELMKIYDEFLEKSNGLFKK